MSMKVNLLIELRNTLTCSGARLQNWKRSYRTNTKRDRSTAQHPEVGAHDRRHLVVDGSVFMDETATTVDCINDTIAKLDGILADDGVALTSTQ
jgi:hypothetical protein